MKINNSKIPILLLIFNREDVAIKAMFSIQEYRPQRLYIAADGPRISKNGEKDKCEKTRQAVLDMIDWECEVKTLFRDQNLGCAKAVSTAIDWFFNNEEFGIIVEDDIVLSQDFYRFAKEIDDKYRNDERIMCINAQYIGHPKNFKSSYVFSTMGSPWGWATWRRAWQHMDLSMSLFPRNSLIKHIKSFGFVRALFLYYYYWEHDYRIISSGGDISSWATRWSFNIFANGGLVVVPTVNMAINVGLTGTQSTHYETKDKNLYSFMKLEKLPTNLSHPNEIKVCKKMRKIESRDFIRIRVHGLKKKLQFHH